MDSPLLKYGEDETSESSGHGGSYFVVILENVTIDGWVVIVMLVIMAAISWIVMFAKGYVISQVRKDNRKFLDKFRKLNVDDTDRLDSKESDEDVELQNSPLTQALFGKHDHFQSSTIYHLYHIGAQQLNQRLGKAVGADAARLSPSAIEAMRASIDADLVRQNQKLNSQMVLLTIAISGGPFLGLLGTVVGVMITFAAIAASGDVNINAIAPGIAAALVATVAGLAVAIPALFGYNYLASRIKEISSDMHVFVDEFITRVAERHGR
jgi:biopolymer transport protein ExbB